MKLSEHVNKFSNKPKMIITTVAVLMVLGGSLGYRVYADSQKKKQMEHSQILVDQKSKETKNLQTEIKMLFDTEKPDFLNKDVSEETLSPIREKLDNIEKNYDSIVLPTKEIKTKDYSNNLTSCKESLKTVQSMLAAQKEVNGLFGKAVIAGDTVTKDVAIKDGLKAGTVKTAKDSFYNKESKSEWQKSINGLLDNADEQLNQIEKSKQTLGKIYKNNKVINIDQKNYDSAKSEIDKIRNEKAKKELVDKLAEVKQEIDSKTKVESEKKELAMTESTTKKTQEQDSQVDQSEASTNNGSPQTATNNGTQEGYSPYVPEQSTGGSGSSAGSGSNGSTGGGSSGSGSTPVQPTEPSEPSTPSGPPAGWIAPPFPIGSAELAGWLADQGYSGYWSSDGYIQPY